MKKTFLGVVLCAAALWGMQAVWASVRSVDTTSENLISKSDFTEISSLGDYKQEPLVFNEWLMYHDANTDKDDNAVKIELVDDATRGQVLSFYGRPKSYYTSYVGQRIEGKMKKGIYRLTFWAKSDDGAKINSRSPYTGPVKSHVPSRFLTLVWTAQMASWVRSLKSSLFSIVLR